MARDSPETGHNGGRFRAVASCASSGPSPRRTEIEDEGDAVVRAARRPRCAGVEAGRSRRVRPAQADDADWHQLAWADEAPRLRRVRLLRRGIRATRS